MNEESKSVTFRLLHASDKDCSQLVGFLLEGPQFICWHDFPVHEEFEPVSRFLQLLKPSFELADKLGR